MKLLPLLHSLLFTVSNACVGSMLSYIYSKQHWAKVAEDPPWCYPQSHNGQSTLSSPLSRVCPGPALCWHPGPSSSCASLGFSAGALQTILLQGSDMPQRSWCSSCIPTASEKERAGLGPSVKQCDSFCRAAGCKETWGREDRNKSLPRPRLIMSLLVMGIQMKANQQLCRVVFPCSSGKSWRLTLMGKQFLPF